MGNYIVEQDVRDFGITADIADSTKVTEAIAFAEAFLENFTRKKFYQRTLTLTLDGTGTDILWLLDYAPIISITSVKVDSETIDAAYYKIYNSEGYIEINKGSYNVYVGSTLYTFPKGTKNVEVIGSFGYSVVPPLVKRVCLLLAQRDLRPETKKGNFKSESIGDYSYNLDNSGADRVTGDFEIDTLLSTLSNPITLKVI